MRRGESLLSLMNAMADETDAGHAAYLEYLEASRIGASVHAALRPRARLRPSCADKVPSTAVELASAGAIAPQEAPTSAKVLATSAREAPTSAKSPPE